MKEKKPASIEATVKKATNLILNGNCNPSILNQLVSVNEQIENRNFKTDEEKAIAFPVFKAHSVSELIKIRTQLAHVLQEQILNHELTYVQNFRIIVAISCMYPNRQIPNKNDKIKFAKKYWHICCASAYDMQESMKTLALLDK